MMNFRIAKKALVKLLGDNAHGQFRTLGYQTQNKHAEGLKDNNRLVSVIYDQGQFPKGSSSQYGPVMHDSGYDIVLSASAECKVDISVLQSETATDTERAAALAEMTTASERVDDSIDELIDIVYNILMDARNDSLQMTDLIVSNRWVDSVQKFDTAENGGIVAKTAVLKYSCRVDEIPPGETGNRPDNVIISADNGEGTGATVTNDNTGG